MERFDIQDGPLAGLKIIKRRSLLDSRGSFARLFCQDEIGSLLGHKTIKQINISVTKKRGAVRGLHFQYPPHAEDKIVCCLSGAIWDLALDLRKGSETFLKYYAIELTAENDLAFLLPAGFAHGFQSLTSDVKVLYMHTESYTPRAEGIINALDPLVGIEWPCSITERSRRDRSQAFITGSFGGVVVS
ncbi:MAG: dTDP-4-dehydrorhamnose 3,5-epimerase family protein [Rhodospirillaceae bacterium]